MVLNHMRLPGPAIQHADLPSPHSSLDPFPNRWGVLHTAWEFWQRLSIPVLNKGGGRPSCHDREENGGLGSSSLRGWGLLRHCGNLQLSFSDPVCTVFHLVLVLTQIALIESPSWPLNWSLSTLTSCLAPQVRASFPHLFQRCSSLQSGRDEPYVNKWHLINHAVFSLSACVKWHSGSVTRRFLFCFGMPACLSCTRD